MSWSTSTALKRAAMMATRRRLASKVWVGRRDPVMGAGVYRSPLLGDVTRDLEPEGRDSLQLFGRGKDLHSRHAQVLENLRADAVSTQHLRRRMGRSGMPDVLSQRAHRVREFPRRAVVAQYHDDAGADPGD